MKEIGDLKSWVTDWKNADTAVQDTKVLIEMANEENDSSLEEEIVQTIKK